MNLNKWERDKNQLISCFSKKWVDDYEEKSETRTSTFSLETGKTATFRMKPEKQKILVSLMKRL